MAVTSGYTINKELSKEVETIKARTAAIGECIENNARIAKKALEINREINSLATILLTPIKQEGFTISQQMELMDKKIDALPMYDVKYGQLFDELRDPKVSRAYNYMIGNLPVMDEAYLPERHYADWKSGLMLGLGGIITSTAAGTNLLYSRKRKKKSAKN